MKIFHCDHCDQLVFFENSQCVHCGHVLAYLPDIGQMASLDKAAEDTNLWHSPLPETEGRPYRQCANYVDHQVCNWAIDASDPHPLCVSCRLTRTIPNLAGPEQITAWFRLEQAKRRLVYTVLSLNLPLVGKNDDPLTGLAFDFLDEKLAAGPTPVLTGHASGLITINAAEADDAERERRKAELHEPYRTLLGHFRHESGHYYWDRLIRDDAPLEEFRTQFGDERQAYAEALRVHYETGPQPGWQDQFVSSYAAVHPWEDWAETWAHYLHMIDTLETAAGCGVSIRPRRADEPLLLKAPGHVASGGVSFERLIDSWRPLTYVLNSLNRGLGLSDAYPFALSPPAVAKLRFVHETVEAARSK